MQKSELITYVAKSTGLSQVDTAKVINSTLEAITARLKSGDKVTLTGFGTFAVRKTAARQGVNPRTQQKIRIPAGKRTVFSAGTVLKSVVSGKGAPKKAAPKKKAAPAKKKK